MALLTLNEAKMYLKVDFDEDDALIENLIEQASSVIQRRYGRGFEIATYSDEYYDGDKTQYVFLENFPVHEILEMRINDEVIDPANYELSHQMGVIKVNYLVPAGFGNVRVSYRAGDAEVPGWVKTEILLVVADLYEGRGASLS